MKTFNPDLAEPVNEDSDAMEMDSFLDRLDKRAKSFRVQMIGDAFKELANVAKEERGKLLQVAVKSFAAELAKSEKEIIKQVCDACETHVAEHKKILAQGEELASKLDKLAKMDFTTPADPMVREVRDALASLRSSPWSKSGRTHRLPQLLNPRRLPASALFETTTSEPPR